MLATDLYLGAWLLHSGAVLKGVQVSRSNGKMTAVFDLEGPGLEEHAREWFESRAFANVAAYREKLEELKDRLFEALRQNENERRPDDAHRQARARSAQARR